MPLFGQLDTNEHLAHAPRVEALATAADEFVVDKCQILSFTHEIDIEQGFKVTPKALHPSIPNYCQVIVRAHPDSAFGPFTVAELRVNARAGTNYLAYCIGAFTDNPRAADWLRSRYGVHIRQADVRLRRMYHGIEGRVSQDGRVVFDAFLERPHYISRSDVLYTPNLNLAVVRGKTRLIHQEMEYTLGKAERGGGAATYVAEHAPEGKRGLYTSWIQTTDDGRAVPVAARHHGLPLAARSAVRDLGLARALPALAGAARDLRVHPHAAERIAGVPGDEIRRTHVPGAADGLVRTLVESEDRAARALRRHRRTGGGLVLRPVLFAVLPHTDAQGRSADGQSAGCRRVAACDAVLRGVRAAVRPYRPQARHPHRLPAGRAHVFPTFQRADAFRESRRGGGPAGQSHRRGRRSGRLHLPVRSDRQGPLHQLLRHRQGSARQGRSALRESRGCSRRHRIDTRRRGEHRIVRRRGLVPPGVQGADRCVLSELSDELQRAGYPPSADPERINHPMVLLILTVLVLYVTMVYGPIAAWLVELFPARILYTSMSLPYHIGNGWFGGFLPTVAFALVALTGDLYYGLWYPILVALMTVVIGGVFLRETHGLQEPVGSDESREARVGGVT